MLDGGVSSMAVELTVSLLRWSCSCLKQKV